MKRIKDMLKNGYLINYYADDLVSNSQREIKKHKTRKKMMIDLKMRFYQCLNKKLINKFKKETPKKI
jgi:hypothetical protein